MQLILEACVDSLEAAIAAERRGAHRLELCANLDLDGTTPDLNLVREVMKAVEIPVKVMVRPRGGDFVYTEAEFQQMLNSIHELKSVGVHGIVTGTLAKDNTIDAERIRELTMTAQKMPVTIHKCIDLVPDVFAAIHQLKTIPGISGILSSGQAATAWEGRALLRQMLAQCGDQLVVIVAGMVTQNNLSLLIETIEAREYHGRRIV